MEITDSNLKDLSRDQLISLLISSLSVIGFLFKIIAYSFDTISLLAASILIAAYLFYKNYKKEVLLFAGAMTGDVVLVTIIKTLVHSERPLNGIMQETGFSFPSGHVTSTVVLFGLLTFFINQHWKSLNVKTLTNTFFVAIVILIGFDRIYLNVHWFSDVLGGYLLGAFWLTLFISAFKHTNFKKAKKKEKEH
jgi:undecaprenyl-diphosphatase